MKADRRPRAAIFPVAAALVAACGPLYETTAHRALPAVHGMELKLVQVFEQLPPHVANLRHSVICRSPATARLRGDAENGVPPGWALVGSLADVVDPDPTPSAQRRALDEAEVLARQSLLDGPGWLAWDTGYRLDVTLDRCATWARFRPAESLPLREIDTAQARFKCEPLDCAGIAMELTHPMSIRDLRVDLPRGGAPGRIAFTVESRALAGDGLRHVESLNGGRSWKARPVPDAGAREAALAPDLR